jgi:hypothetical protein
VYVTTGNQFITNASGGWTSSSIIPFATINSTSIAVSDDGSVGIAFMDEGISPNTVKFGSVVGGAVSVEDVAPFGLGLVDSTIGSAVSLAYDSSNQPHIAYNDRGTVTQGLRHAVKTGGTWSVTTVDGTTVVDRGTHLRIQGDDTLSVLYTDRTNLTLRFAQRPAGGAWDIAPVPNSSMEGDFAILSDGQVAVVTNNGGLKFVVPFESLTYGVTLAPSGGQFSGMALDGTGDVHVVYRPYGGNSFEYLRSD